MVVISFAPKGAWTGGADFPMACAMGYDLSPASRAGRTCDQSTRDAVCRKVRKICAVAARSEDLARDRCFQRGVNNR